MSYPLTRSQDANISQQEFGWAQTSSYVNLGIMGIGLGYGWTLDYYNIVDQLYVQGFTNSRAFSLDLMSIDVADGMSSVQRWDNTNDI